MAFEAADRERDRGLNGEEENIDEFGTKNIIL